MTTVDRVPAFSIEIFFDHVTEEAIRQAWDDLSVPARSDYMREHGVFPHVALAVIDDTTDVVRLQVALGKLATQIPAAALDFSGIGGFPGVSGSVYLGFKKNDPLARAHARVADLLKDAGVANHVYYQADMWVPHCTLAEEFCRDYSEEVFKAAKLHDWSLPFIVDRLALVHYPPTILVASWKLQTRQI